VRIKVRAVEQRRGAGGADEIATLLEGLSFRQVPVDIVAGAHHAAQVNPFVSSGDFNRRSQVISELRLQIRHDCKAVPGKSAFVGGLREDSLGSAPVKTIEVVDIIPAANV